MRALGNYLMSGRLQAIAVVTVLTALSWLMPVLTYLLSAVPVGLLTLRRGGAVGAQVILGSFLCTSLLALLGNINPIIAGAYALAVWAPTWQVSMVLRMTESHGAMVMMAGGLGMLFVLVMHSRMDDVTLWWSSVFENWVSQSLPADKADQYQQLLETITPLLNAMMGSVLVITLVATVLIARCWQAMLYNPGAFAGEFRQLRLPRSLFLPTLLALGVLVATDGSVQEIARDLVIVTVFIYLFQGIAAIHRAIFTRKLSPAWLFTLYGFLLLVPQTVLFVACVGMADSLFGTPAGGDSGTA